MASSEKMGPGKYRAVWRDAANKKCHSKAPYFTTSTEAQRYAWTEEDKARRQASREAGTLSPSITWREWVDIWWPTRTIELSTDRTERAALEAELLPKWGGEPLNTISRKTIQPWVDRMALETSPGNAVRVFSILRSSLTAAVVEEVLAASPCVKIKLPVIPPAGIEHFEEDEIELLLEAITTKKSGERYREYCELIFDTGMRPGELGGLHWSAINFSRRSVFISDVIIRGGREIKGVPKDVEGREVPLTTRAIEILTKWRDSRPMRQGCGQPHVVKKVVSKKPCKSDLAFRQPNGQPMNENNLWLIFGRALDRAKLPHRSPYAMRHTYATRLADAGIDVYELARLMGHEDIETTMRYIHRTKTAHDRVLALLGDPAARSLRVVPGQEEESGTRSGTAGPRTRQTETDESSVENAV